MSFGPPFCPLCGLVASNPSGLGQLDVFAHKDGDLAASLLVREWNEVRWMSKCARCGVVA
jgi:hypothetical protein